jgi:hypothetical protein
MEEFGRAAPRRDSLETYRRLLEDPERLALYRRAIRRVVRPGDVIVDVGAGLGVLAAVALRCGARRILARADPPLAALGRAVAADNGLAHRIAYRRASPSDGLPRQRADVLLLENLGDCVFEGGFLRTIRAARRHLKRGAVMIPACVDVFAAPVRDPYFHDTVGPALLALEHDLTFSAAIAGAAHRVYKKWIYPSDFLAPPRAVARIRMAAVAVPRLHMTADFSVRSPGALTGFGLWTDVWFTRTLVARTLSARSWQNLFFPIEAPIRVERSDRISMILDLSEHDDRTEWRWDGRVGHGRSRRLACPDHGNPETLPDGG